MIVKELENSLYLSVKKNNRNELLIILNKEELKEIPNQNGLITYVGIEDGVLQIHAALEKDLIKYIFPHNQELVDTINRYEINHVLISFRDEENLMSSEIVFTGFLKLFNQ